MKPEYQIILKRMISRYVTDTQNPFLETAAKIIKETVMECEKIAQQKPEPIPFDADKYFAEPGKWTVTDLLGRPVTELHRFSNVHFAFMLNRNIEKYTGDVLTGFTMQLKEPKMIRIRKYVRHCNANIHYPESATVWGDKGIYETDAGMVLVVDAYVPTSE